MRRWLLMLGGTVLAASYLNLAAQPPDETVKVELNGHTFTLPAGFAIELAAASPLVDRPISADFDEQGRLYVSDSSGSNEKVDVQLQKKPHRIVRLEDTDGDGKFDKTVDFADRMMFPEGTMWRDGSLYVAAPPSIWKLTDTDGDGVADQRSEWFQGKTLTGCANDLHGPYAGPDGWIYWCKGAFAKQTYEVPGKKPFVTRASHIFRARPDGSGVEPVMTGGMDNPVDVVFTPSGERIFTTTFFQYPAAGKRDGLVHAVYGGVYGKDYDVVYEHPWTSPALMPVLTHLGPAAPCGLHRYESRAFGPDYQDNLFACLFNMQKVTRHQVVPDGATFVTRDHDFLVSSNKDFHPTDVIEDADGSLLVVDTGGWYKLCCPTSQLVKPDVLGAVYRVRKKNAPRLDDPRGLRIAWASLSPEELARHLDDARPFVRRRAVDELGRRGGTAVEALRDTVRTGRSAEGRQNAVWASCRLDDDKAREVARLALDDLDETVRQVALHAVAVRRDAGAVPKLLAVLRGESEPNRRAAAEALGRVGNASAVPALLRAAAATKDRVLEHSMTYALIEIAAASPTAEGLKSKDASTRRAALVALDQMENGGLKADLVVRHLDALDPRLREAAWWIASRHAEWGADLTGALRQRVTDGALTPAQRDDLVQQLAKLGRSPAIQTLVADVARDRGLSAEARQTAIKAMAQSAAKEAPAAWLDALSDVLASGGLLRRDAVSAARVLRLPKQVPPRYTDALLKAGHDAAVPEPVRLDALAAVPAGSLRLDAATLAFLADQLKPEHPIAARTLAADVVSRASLTADQLVALTAAVRTSGPLETSRLLDAFARSTDPKVGRQLVDALRVSPARAGLRAEQLRPVLAKFGPGLKEPADALFTQLDADAAQMRSKLDALYAQIGDGDVRRGHVVFYSPKAACVACHTIGYLGGKVGPDLTRIGSVRTERDLLESIVFPGASFVRGYEPVVVTTTSGKAHNGVIRRDTSEELVLATGVDQEVRLPRDEIDEMQPSRISVMPAGLDQQLSTRDLADLVAFLRACHPQRGWRRRGKGYTPFLPPATRHNEEVAPARRDRFVTNAFHVRPLPGRPRVGLFIPCYVDQLYPRVGMATLEILEACGLDVDFPEAQTCCGQPMANTGCTEAARPLAERFLQIFGGYDYVVAPSGSCVAMVRMHYGEYLDGRPGFDALKAKTFELCEFLTDVLKVERIDGRFAHRVGLHNSCHGLRELRLGKASELVGEPFSKARQVLELLDGIEFAPLARPDECCGFGGTFAVAEEAVSCMMGQDRVHDHEKAGTEVLTANDMSCLMHLEGLIRRERKPMRVMHVAEILAGDRT